LKFHNEYRELFQELTIPYTTIPFQSGSNKILKNMNRHYDARQVVEIIKELKQLSPRTYIEGHFIVGYPGETNIDFLKSLFITQYFDYPVALIYSEAKEMKSATLPQKKSQMTKQMRHVLMIFFINFIVLFKLATNP
jgi:tRNA-2-methylthio-N6-dimethylallyladenosine synthase